MRERKRPFYGWFVCAGCAMLLFCTSGLAVNAFTIYQPYLLRLNGFTNAQASLIVTIRSLTGLVSMLLTGRYYARLSLRTGMALAGAMAAGGFFVFGAARGFFVYALAAALVGLGYGFGTMIPVSMVMERWFIEKRTLALGICSAVTGLSTLGVPTLLTWAIERFGLAAAFRAEGAGMALLVLAAALLIRSRPAELGLRPYGDWDAAGPAALNGRPEGLRARDWRLLVPVLLCVGAFTSVGYSHIAVLAVGEGFSAHMAALAVTVSGIVLMVTKFGYGLLTERLTARRTNWLFGGALIAGLALCCFLRGSAARLFLAMLVYGAGLPLGTVGLTVWAGDLSTPEQYDGTIRRFQVGYAAGSLLFSPLPGLLADRCGGSYVPAYAVFTAFAAFAVLAIAGVYRRRVGGPEKRFYKNRK